MTPAQNDPSPPQPDPNLTRWSGWLETIFQELAELHHDRAIWHQLRDIVLENKNIPDPWFFLNWTSGLWASSMAVGIRRLSDQGNNVISLARLIRDVGQHPEVLSRGHYRRLYQETYPDDAYMLRRAGEEYDQLAGAGEDQLTPSATPDDLLQLSTAAQSVRHHVNKACGPY